MNRSSTNTSISPRAVSLICYNAEILKWSKNDQQAMETKTQKIISMNRMHYPGVS